MGIFKRVSTIALVAALLAYLIERNPYTGIFLMFFGGPALPGLLVDVALVALFVEAWTGRAPWYLALIPVLAIGAYYGVYLDQLLGFRAHNAELHAMNGARVAYDPAHYALVDSDAAALVRRYAIPTAYNPEPSQPEGYFVHMLVPSAACDAVPRDSQVRVRKMFGAGKAMGSHLDLCNLSLPQRPSLPLLEVVRDGANVYRLLSQQKEYTQTTEIRVDGAVKARFTTLTTWRLANFPLLIAGCMLIDASSSWQCTSGFLKRPVTLDGYSTAPAGSDRTAPESIMLGLHEYDEDALNNFKAYPQNQASVVHARGEASRVTEDVFTAFETALGDEDAPLPFNAAYSVTVAPEKLVPLADKMAERFDALMRDGARGIEDCLTADQPNVPRETRHDTEALFAYLQQHGDGGKPFKDCMAARPHHPGRQELLRTIAAGLAALPPGVFTRLAPGVLEDLQQLSDDRQYAARRHSLLYIRTGDSGTAGLVIYKRDLQSSRFMQAYAALAICRAGRADGETVALLREILVSGPIATRDAAAVALLKLDQRDFVRQHLDRLSSFSKPWAEILLDGKGWTPTGPNNCAPARDEFTSPLSAAMQPALVFHGMRGGWQPRG